MDVRAPLKIKILQIDEVSEMPHSNCRDQVTTTKAECCKVCESCIAI